MLRSRFFRYSIGVLLVLLNIFLFYKISFLLSPLADFFAILFIPLIVSGLLYYLLRPFVRALENLRIPRTISILLVYLIIIILLANASATVLPSLIRQMNELAAEVPDKFDAFRAKLESWLRNYGVEWGLYDIKQKSTEMIQQATKLVSENVIGLISIITRFATILVSVPFILFFLLKGETRVGEFLRENVRGEYSTEMQKILMDIDNTLSSYIVGQATIACSLGLMLFVGYSIIGLNFALLLALIAVVMDFIPYIGAFLSFVPALLVGVSSSWWLGAQAAIVFIVAQQIETQILYPLIIGRRLQISPLTVMLLLLGAGSLYGLLGLILVTPVYALGKVIATNLYKIYVIRYALHTLEKKE